jgi:hypothetical protein
MLFILLLIATVVFYLKYNQHSKPIVKCNIDRDNSCKMYNHRDIQSKCESMCIKQNPQYNFTGQHKQVNNEHMCECSYLEEKFTLDFTNVNDNPDIIPDVIPTDAKFSDRNYLETEQEKRYKGLIFGE